MRFSLVTFGCRVNQADSLRIEEQLLARGGRPSGSECADLVIVNTCSVTANADQGARQTIRRIARDNPAARIIVTGCYATRREEEVAALPSVLRVVPNPRKDGLLAELDDIGLTTAERFAGGDGACGAGIEPGMMGRTAYTVRVQTGCDEKCSYCIIPSTRGSSRSHPPAEILGQVERAAGAGFKEVILTGVHLGSYGRDLGEPTTLLDLLRRLSESSYDLLYRVSSLEPMDCTTEIVELMAASGRFAPHFHLPLQHASDRILTAMRRPYSASCYRRLVDSIRARLPHASIGSDVIVGFPGETDEDAQRNASYLAETPLTHLHVFPYSDRPGTVATGLPGKVGGAVIRQRAAEIRQVGHSLAERFRASQLGSIRPGLTIDDGSTVVTDNYLKVRIPAGLVRNERLRVRILAVAEPMLGVALTAENAENAD